MRRIAAGFLTTALIAACASAQKAPTTSVEKILYFAHTDDPRNMQEIAHVMLSEVELPQATLTESQRSLKLRGTKDEIAAAEWLFSELDRSTGTPRQHSTNREFVMPGQKEGVVRVFYAGYAANLQAFQEIAQILRTVPEIRRTFSYNALDAIIIRGTPAQIRLAESIFNELDKPVSLPIQHAATPEFLLAGDKEGVTRIFYIGNAASVPAFQEIAQAIRTTVEVRRTFTNNSHRAIIVRGTDDQVAMAEWLFNELDQPNLGPSIALLNSENPHEYHTTGGADDVVRVFFLTGTADIPAFQKIAQQVRVSAGIMRTFTYNDRRALVVRGTSLQIAAAARIVKPD